MMNLTKKYLEFLDDCSDVFSDEHTFKFNKNKPRPLVKTKQKRRHKFIIKGVEIMAMSRKDAFKKYNHLNKR